MNTGQSVGEVRSLRSIAGPSRHSCLADLHCWSTPLYIVGRSVADSTSVPVHWVAGTRSAQVRRRIHRLHRPGAQNQGAVWSGRTNHRSLQVRADTPVCSSPSCLWCLERVSNVIVIKFIFKSKNSCAYKKPSSRMTHILAWNRIFLACLCQNLRMSAVWATGIKNPEKRRGTSSKQYSAYAAWDTKT